ncbi:MAG TPA: DUF362 domain-containing protein [Spirochaetota bacterium]|nr:DUF362 domain-containing protein [Spirochaetota bacterium]
MKKSKVALIRCEEYQIETVYDAIKKGINLIGGIDNFVKEGEKILLKPNILAGRKPEKATTTHPIVFEAVVKILLEKNVIITYGDSPGFDKPSVGLTKSGITEVADRYDVKQADFDSGQTIDNPNAPYGKTFEIAQGVLDADGLISLSKMKSHQLTRITGAIKNQFGCVYGINKAKYHVKLPNATMFSGMLVDLNIMLKPRLYIMDGIVAMEGNGPASGDPVKMNCILISDDPVALDATFCRMVSINPEFIPTNLYGYKAGLGVYLEENIEIVGDRLEDFVNKSFKVVRKPVKEDAFVKKLERFRNLLVSRPVIDKNKCVKCGICVEACPVEGKAILFKNGKKNPPSYLYKKCIRCYCCQEVCPHKSIFVKIPFLGKILGVK